MTRASATLLRAARLTFPWMGKGLAGWRGVVGGAVSLTSSSGLASSVHGPITAEACDPGAMYVGSLQLWRRRRRARAVKSERFPGLPGGVETSLTGNLESARSPGLPGGVETSRFSEFAWCLLEMA